MVVTQIILCALAAFAFVDGFEFAAIAKKHLSKWFDIPVELIHLKPLDCRYCLAFWLALMVSLCDGWQFMAIIHGLAAAAIVEFIYLISKILEKHGE